MRQRRTLLILFMLIRFVYAVIGIMLDRSRRNWTRDELNDLTAFRKPKWRRATATRDLLLLAVCDAAVGGHAHCRRWLCRIGEETSDRRVPIRRHIRFVS